MSVKKKSGPGVSWKSESQRWNGCCTCFMFPSTVQRTSPGPNSVTSAMTTASLFFSLSNYMCFVNDMVGGLIYIRPGRWGKVD